MSTYTPPYAARLVFFVIIGLSAHLFASENQVSIATFNAEWLGYPQNSGSWSGTRESQISQAADDILAMDVDIVALQEVVVDDLNGNALFDLIGALNAQDSNDSWNGVYNPRFSYWWAPDFENWPATRQAFVWKRSKVQYVKGLVLLGGIPSGDYRFASGRLPLMIQVNVDVGDFSVPLYLVNLHLKCCPGFDDTRNVSMSTLMQDLRTFYADKPMVVLGDFNVADRGGANGEIAEWGFYADHDFDGVPDYFHGAGSVADTWDDLDHIMFSDELSDPYLTTPVASRNIRGSSSVSDHDPIITHLSWEPDLLDYTLIWSDEFDQPDGSLPDPANWVHEIGFGPNNDGWGNWEEQYYTNSTDNTRIENGQLVIELHEDSSNEYPGNDYTSGRLTTRGLHDWTYGRMEARIRLPFGNGSGLWPAFWMLGADIFEVGWPDCGEIDIMEYVSHEPYQTFGTIHGPGYFGGNGIGGIYEFGNAVAPPEPPDLVDPFDAQYYHVFAVEWEADRIRWFIDDILYHEATPADVFPNSWVFDHDHYITLNMAIGGNFGGTIDEANLVFPTQMLVDYVRVYSINQIPELTLTKTGTFQDENGNGFADTGETIAYAFSLENSGSTELTNVEVSDPMVTISANFPDPPNLLTNAGFESGDASGWITSGTVVSSYIESGSHSLEINAPGGTYPAAFQSLPASPGDVINLSGYMHAGAGLPADGTFGLFKIVFQDSSGNDLVPASVSSGILNSSSYPGAESQPFLNSSSPANTWIYSEAQAVAPTGTASVLLFALNIDLSPAIMFFDSIKAYKVPQTDALNLTIGETDNSTFSGTYILTESDINAGWVENTSVASCDQILGVSASTQTYLPLNTGHDTDNDGFYDIFERAYGLDIFAPNSTSMGPESTLVDNSGEKHLQLNYRRRTSGTGTTGVNYTADGILYKVEVSDDLKFWYSGDLYVEETGSRVDNGDGTETVNVRAIAPVSGSGRFLRLNVAEAP